jgi:hypothetical protein
VPPPEDEASGVVRADGAPSTTRRLFFIVIAILFTRGCGFYRRAFDLEPEETLADAIVGATLGTEADATSTGCTSPGAVATAGI